MVTTLADLHRGRFLLWVQCEGCGDMNTLSPFELIGMPEIPGADSAPLEGAMVAEVAARLRCSRCGSRNPKWTRKSRSGGCIGIDPTLEELARMPKKRLQDMVLVDGFYRWPET